jgi:hypothetical protein
MSHYCISNPCWICYPEFAPKYNEKNYIDFQQIIEEHKIPENKISELLKNLLIEVFEYGLGEGQHFCSINVEDDISLAGIKEERLKLSSDTLESKLIDLLIKDFEEK